ncbi:tetratricopeptide repeat protein [Streptomyces pseudogriseolus]|uniref:tetratricopeptide repeat protein n=1 Tax=Streptomyces pseudogriseolus TaxID=36817 RepID=UPI003FA2C347
MSPRTNDSPRGSGGQEASRPAEAPEASKAPVAAEAPEASRASSAAADAPRSPSTAERVDALRRFAAAVRRGRGLHGASCAVLLAVAMTAGAVAVGGDGRDAARAAPGVSRAVGADVLVRGDLDTAIRSLQAHVRAQPRDFGAWAALGLAQVERARTDGDPSRYARAERALARSLALRPGNDQALAGQAALAAARHDFAAALDHADRALERNPYSERALCSRIDALVELGRYMEAGRAATVADRRRPGVPVFTRYAYVRELRGDVPAARRVLHRALDSAAGPADVAYVATALGNLERGQGRYGAALRHYARALAADDAYLPALEGRARAQAADGDRAGAITTLEQVVARSPLPGPLVALGELYEDRNAPGDRAKARGQYALVDAWTALARAGGVDVDLDTALAAADHGDTAEALRAARAEWNRRRTVHTADALAWALHRAGRSAEALPYARRATATGYRDAAFLHHRGMIEKATGHDRAARASLTAALELNPGFSPLGASAARAALKDLEAAR